MIPTRVRRLTVSTLAAAGIVAGSVQMGAGAAVAAPAAARTSFPVTSITVNPTARAKGSLPAGFIGFAYPSTDINDGHYAYLGNYPALLANFGPGVMRFGGNTVDSPAYTGATSATLKGLAKLTRKTGWKVLYTVNMATSTPAQIKADARHVSAALRTHLLAIACGNEPELWSRENYKGPGYVEANFLADLPQCVTAVRSGAAKARLAGPDTYVTSWLPSYASAVRAQTVPKPAWLTEHFYPMTNCGSGTQGGAATLLARTTATKEKRILNQTASAARVARVPYLMDETNSASCRGITGVSNTYASALWAADWLMLGAEHGARGMYFNGHLNTSCTGYTPLCEAHGSHYVPEPVYYGMLFAHLMGTGRTLPVKVLASSAAGDIAAHVVRSSGGGIRVMVENLNPTSTTVVLHVAGATGWAAVWRLTGPSLGATGGVRIQGSQVRSSGHFATTAGHVKCHAGICRLTLAAYSGVVLRVP